VAVREAQAATRSPLDRWRRLRLRYPNLRAVIAVWVIFVLMFLIGRLLGYVTALDNQFETTAILASFAAVVAFGQAIVILTGGIDLSVPFTITITSVILTGTAVGEDGRWWAVPLVLLMAFGIGVWNGVGVAFLKISPLIMTLATNVILLGLILIYTSGTPRGLSPPFLVEFMTGKVGPVRNVILATVVFVAVATLLLTRTVFGRYVYAVGNSPQVAYLSGVPVKAVLVGVYATASLSYGLAGVMLTGWARQSALNLGDPYLFPSIAAVVLGGVSILGGRGHFLGVVGGALVFTGIGTILAGTTIPESTRSVIFGLVLLGAVALIQRERVGS
jgi:ribose transport system permease protein